MSGQAVREQLAAIVAAAVPASWTVYAAPPEVVATPAAVIVPRTPYRRPGTLCAEIIGIAVTLLEARAAGVQGVNDLDALADVVLAELTSSLSGLVYESTELGPMIAPGGAEAYGATLNLELYL